MHIDETSFEADRARQLYGGRSAVAHLDHLGILGDEVSLAHAVWVDDGDIETLARTRSVVVHNPASNMRLGSGRAPVTAIHRAGVRVALGSDGAASNDSQDVFEAAKFALLAARTGQPGDTGPWLTASEVLHMATDGGRDALGLPHARIAPGRRADLVAIDLDSPPLVPLHNAAAQLVLGGPSVAVRHTFINGRRIVRDGRMTTFDEAALYEEARAIAKSWAEND